MKRKNKILTVIASLSLCVAMSLGVVACASNANAGGKTKNPVTAKEVYALRQKGIEVIGIFTGGSREMETAQRIFGRDWIKIQDMNQFSEAVGKILRQKLYERGGV